MTNITEEEVKLVQSVWQQVVPKSFEVSEIFYNRLFDQHPDFRPMFKEDMKEQGKKLMQMIGTVVLGLSNLSKIESTLQETGKRHVDYGVKPEDYTPLRNVLLWTFQEAMGEAFTPEMALAWSKTYDIMAEMMINATKEEDSMFMRILKRSKFW